MSNLLTLNCFAASVGRVLDRLTNLFPKRIDTLDLEGFKHWLRFGLNRSHRGHDGVSTPIIDANCLFNFLRLARYAKDYCVRRALSDLGRTWADIESAALGVENQ